VKLLAALRAQHEGVVGKLLSAFLSRGEYLVRAVVVPVRQ
jgi:hypothetical protein